MSRGARPWLIAIALLAGVASAWTPPASAVAPHIRIRASYTDVLNDVTPVDDAVASGAYRSAVLPKLVTEALDHLEHA